jgi:hypothetical protein
MKKREFDNKESKSPSRGEVNATILVKGTSV